MTFSQRGIHDTGITRACVLKVRARDSAVTQFLCTSSGIIAAARQKRRLSPDPRCARAAAVRMLVARPISENRFRTRPTREQGDGERAHLSGRHSGARALAREPGIHNHRPTLRSRTYKTGWGYGFRAPASKSAKPTWTAGPGMTARIRAPFPDLCWHRHAALRVVSAHISPPSFRGAGFSPRARNP
jgi:hypothetical protein